VQLVHDPVRIPLTIVIRTVHPGLEAAIRVVDQTVIIRLPADRAVVIQEDLIAPDHLLHPEAVEHPEAVPGVVAADANAPLTYNSSNSF
jgi:hypothetical protein